MQPMPRLTMRRCVCTVLLCAVAMAGQTEPGDLPLLQSKAYLQISPAGQAELEALFATLEDAVAAGEAQPDPVVVVLHGPEARRFLRRNYLDNQPLVDRAAKLRAFDRIELRMCETWMRSNGVGRGDLLPFVDTIPLAPAEVERLEREGYLPFSRIVPSTPLL